MTRFFMIAATASLIALSSCCARPVELEDGADWYLTTADEEGERYLVVDLPPDSLDLDDPSYPVCAIIGRVEDPIGDGLLGIVSWAGNDDARWLRVRVRVWAIGEDERREVMPGRSLWLRVIDTGYFGYCELLRIPVSSVGYQVLDEAGRAWDSMRSRRRFL